MIWTKQPIKTSIKEINDKVVSPTDLGNFASESDLISALNTKLNGMQDNEVSQIRFQMTSATASFKTYAYTGTLTRITNQYASLNVTVCTSYVVALCVVGSKNTNWKFEELALKSDVTETNNSLNKLGEQINSSNAGAHNGIYRGKYLGTSVTAEQYAAIKNGTFDDLYIGDYWTIGGHDWVICDFDYYIQCGVSNVNQHHLVMMPRTNMNIPSGTALYGTSGTLELLDGESATSKKWNATSDAPSAHTTAGGYKYSRMRTIIMKAANTIVINAFGSDHVLAFAEVYYNPASETDSGLAGNMADFNDRDQSSLRCRSICDLCNETMVYGQQVWGRGLSNTNPGYEIGIDKFQLAIFALNHKFANITSTWWLRSVSSNAFATAILSDGCANVTGPGIAKGVRPRFLLVG